MKVGKKEMYSIWPYWKKKQRNTGNSQVHLSCPEMIPKFKYRAKDIHISAIQVGMWSWWPLTHCCVFLLSHLIKWSDELLQLCEIFFQRTNYHLAGSFPFPRMKSLGKLKFWLKFRFQNPESQTEVHKCL